MVRRIVAALLAAVAAAAAAGCARPDYAGDPLVRTERTILRQDLEEFRIAGKDGRFVYRIRGVPSEVLYYPRDDGRVEIVRVRRAAGREWLAVPAAGAEARVEVRSGPLAATADTVLGPDGGLPDRAGLDGRMIDAFVARTGTIPDGLDLYLEVRNGYVFLDDRDPARRGRSRPRAAIPASLSETRRIGGEAIEARVRAVVLERDDPGLKGLYAATYDTPYARLWRLEVGEKPGVAGARKVLACCRALKAGLGADFPGLEERCDRRLEQAMFAAITGRNELGLAREYDKLYAAGKSYGRAGEVREHVRRARDQAERRRLDALIRRAEAERDPFLLEDYEQSARSKTLARRAAQARQRLVAAMLQAAERAGAAGREAAPAEAGPIAQTGQAEQTGPPVQTGQNRQAAAAGAAGSAEGGSRTAGMPAGLASVAPAGPLPAPQPVAAGMKVGAVPPGIGGAVAAPAGSEPGPAGSPGGQDGGRSAGPKARQAADEPAGTGEVDSTSASPMAEPAAVLAAEGSPGVVTKAVADGPAAQARSGPGEGPRIRTRSNGRAGELVVFSRPTTFSDPLKLIRAGGSYPLLGRVREFYEIEFEPGRTGYVHRRFVEEGTTGGE